jgi:hypothetical protein
VFFLFCTNFPSYLTNIHLGKFDSNRLKTSGIQVDLDIIWNKAYGGQGIDYCESLIKTQDGGFVMVGRTNSSGAGDYDIFILRTDNNGNELWNKTLGDQYKDYGYQIVEALNGDLIIIGDHQWGSQNYAFDVYLARIDSTGTILRWNYTFGDSNSQEMGRSLYISNNSDFLLGGVFPISGLESEIWLIKTDRFGIQLWNRTYGGNETDRCFQNNLVLECKNGDILIGGYTISFGSGESDIWLIRTDSYGNKIWNKTFGGSKLDRPQMISECNDGGIIICANTMSYGEGDLDLYVLKTNQDGNLLWNFTLGCETLDEARSVVELDDGGFLISGSTTKFGTGNGGLWLVKTDTNGDIEWETSFGESYNEICKSMVMENQSTFIFSGKTEKNGNEDMWLVKINIGIVYSTNNSIPGYTLIYFISFLSLAFLIILVKKKLATESKNLARSSH